MCGEFYSDRLPELNKGVLTRRGVLSADVHEKLYYIDHHVKLSFKQNCAGN